jgi:uncharacterized protein YndB with AHSA1/START domain
MTTNRLGEILRDRDRYGLRYERRLRHPPEKVWRALTESEALRHWMPADMLGERRAGADLLFAFWPAHVQRFDIPSDQAVLAGRMLTWQPPHLLEYSWDADVLRFELEPDGEGTRLVFTTWLGDTDQYPADGTAAGYHAALDQLAELLDTGTVALPVIDVPLGDLEERYAALLTDEGS